MQINKKYGAYSGGKKSIRTDSNWTKMLDVLDNKS